jgi:hypothetical protein
VGWRILGGVLSDWGKYTAPTLFLSSFGSLPCWSMGCCHDFNVFGTRWSLLLRDDVRGSLQADMVITNYPLDRVSL